MPSTPFDIAVVGTGPAGLATALALLETGLTVALAGPMQIPDGRKQDRRTAALFTRSIILLKNLGVWQDCNAAVAPISAIRIIDDRPALLRAPEVVFRAGDIGLAVFGYNVPNLTLTTALWQAVRHHGDRLAYFATDAVSAINVHDSDATLQLGDGNEINARLIVGADGRHSLCRQAAGISVRSWPYPQSAVTASFAHSRDHNDISTEFHTRQGPCTVVPLPNQRSSLVWVVAQSKADHLKHLSDGEFAQALEQQLQGLLGEINDVTPRTVFPLSAAVAEKTADKGIALVGEAAHVLPPIGAQGLNLGLRDCAELVDCVMDAKDNASNSFDHDQCLTRYAAKRAFDIHSRTAGVDIFNRSLLTGFLPAHLLRGAGLHAMAALAPLRRLAMQAGLSPAGFEPKLMQLDGLKTSV